ncbi:MAG: hypothetical protein ACYTF1_15770 [Planctomycetota bacterium]|jgi:hypothetical protein
MRREKTITVVITLLMLGVGVSVVKGYLITFKLQGVVDYVDDSLNRTGVSIGESWSVVYTLDSETPDIHPLDPDFGVYPVGSISFEIGGKPFTTRPGSAVIISDSEDVPNFDHDQYTVASELDIPFVDNAHMQVALLDREGNVFSSDALPLAPLSMDLIEDNGLYFKGGGLALVFIKGPVISFTLEPATLSLDIKPGSCPNPLNTNTRGKGKLPMAILGTEDFDIRDIDLDSISIADAAFPVKTPSIEDVSTPVDEDECTCQEVGPDGFADLVIHYSRREVIIALGLDEMAPGTEVPITVTGELLDGTPFEATDCVLLVGRED